MTFALRSPSIRLRPRYLANRYYRRSHITPPARKTAVVKRALTYRWFHLRVGFHRAPKTSARSWLAFAGNPCADLVSAKPRDPCQSTGAISTAPKSRVGSKREELRLSKSGSLCSVSGPPPDPAQLRRWANSRRSQVLTTERCSRRRQVLAGGSGAAPEQPGCS